MRNLFLFISKYYAFFLFLLLEAFCVYLIYQHKAYHRAFITQTSSNFTGRILETYTNATDYLKLGRINDSLMAENAMLRSLYVPSSKAVDTIQEIEISDSLTRWLYKYIPTKVINNPMSKAHNFITLNRGSKHGISKDMGVMSEDGVVGKVIRVSENFSLVMSLLNEDFTVVARHKGSGKQGTVHWEADEGGDIAFLENISQPAKLRKEDSVVTGASTIFPENVMIGTVEAYTLKEGSNFYDIKLNLATDFSKLRYVYVINYMMKQEQGSLEATVAR